MIPLRRLGAAGRAAIVACSLPPVQACLLITPYEAAIPSLARPHAGADLHPVAAGGRRVRACPAERRARGGVVGRAAARLGLPAIPAGRTLSAAGGGRRPRHGGGAAADRGGGTVSLYAQ